MPSSSLLRALSVTALALAACSSDSNNLLDGAPKPDDAFEDAPVDIPVDAPADAPVDSPRDVPDVPDASDASDVIDATDVTLDAPIDAPIDAPVDAPRDVTLDAPIDAPRDVTLDAPLDAPIDAPRDVTLDAPVDAPVDAPRDVTLDAPIDAPRDVTLDAPIDVPRDTPVDAPVDVPRDVGPDTSCGALTRCAGVCVNTQTDLNHCGGCGVVCPGADTECRRRTCVGGACGFANTSAGTALTTQSPRDCRRAVCDGAGAVSQLPDDADLPVDGNACTDDRCASGVASNPATPIGRGCGTGAMLCDGAGACVECVRGSDCAEGVCVTGRCQSASCSDGIRNGSETGVDCGGSCPVCAALVVFAGGTSGVLAGSFNATARTWSATTLAGRTTEGVSVAVTPSGEAVGLMRFTQLGDVMDNRLRYSVWRAGAWAPFADIGPTVTTQGQPAVVSSPTGVFVAFHGFDFNHYFASWNGTTWAPPAEPTGASGARSGALARDGANAMLVFSRGLANELYTRTRAGASWGGDQMLDGAAGFDFNASPSAVNLSSTSVLAVWNAPGGQLRASRRTAGAWSTPAAVPMALSTARVSVARVSDTQAALAFRGTDGNLYASAYTSGVWAAPARVAMGITGVPAVARGLTGASAELAFLDGTGRVMHSRLAAGVWGAPALVGGTGLTSVALASGP